MDYRLAYAQSRKKMPNVACNLLVFFSSFVFARTTRGFPKTKPAKTEHECDGEEYSELWNICKTENTKGVKRKEILDILEFRCRHFWNFKIKKIITTSCIPPGQCKNHNQSHTYKRLVSFSFPFIIIWTTRDSDGPFDNSHDALQRVKIVLEMATTEQWMHEIGLLIDSAKWRATLD